MGNKTKLSGALQHRLVRKVLEVAQPFRPLDDRNPKTHKQPCEKIGQHPRFGRKPRRMSGVAALLLRVKTLQDTQHRRSSSNEDM